MSALIIIKCKHCGRDTFKSEKGLKQHLRYSKSCAKLNQDELQLLKSDSGAKLGAITPVILSEMAAQIDAAFDATLEEEEIQEMNHGKLDTHAPSDEESMASNEDNNADFDNDPDEDFDNDEDPPVAMEDAQVNRTLANQFLEYVDYADNNFLNLDKNMVNAIELADVLRKKRATLDTYDAVMEWHYRAM